MTNDSRDALYLVALFVLVVVIYGLACAFARGATPALSAREQLGLVLFFDKRMSIDGTTSCSSCHDPKFGWSDGRRVAVGLVGSRRSANGFEGEFNSPTILGRRREQKQFFDQRATDLADQVLQPTLNNIEMGNDSIRQLVGRIDRISGYGPLFAAAFGDPRVSADRMRTALVAFIETVKSENAPVDQLLAGNDDERLSDAARRGFEIMRVGRCFECHRPESNFSDETLHRTGIALRSGKGQRNTVKTPTLREIQRSGPYMRDGSLTTLADVVRWYDSGGRYIRGGKVLTDTRRDPRIQPLGLDETGRADLEAFLTEGFAGDMTWYEVKP